MSWFSALADHSGLVALTVVAIGLTVYLLYVMIHPERI
ncbi:MAG TPA: potassium-transporting ATPase subunit F [Thermoplasmata archaeon]|nr:potassium-transporting ATPase subunit F [Thermoplasmata archaeon]